MPKIIENLEQKLLQEAGRQAMESGYSSMTIRSIAKACGVGVGTVYNYFSSKDMILAAFMLEEWKECIAVIHTVSCEAQTAQPVLRCIYDQLIGYMQHHHTLFQDEAASAAFSGSFSQYHGLLRSQLAHPLRKFCQNDFASEFIAEALLTWTVAGKGFEEIHNMIQKLF